MLLNYSIIVGITIQEQQSIFLTKSNTTLIEQAIIQSNIFSFSFTGNEYHLKRLEGDAIGLSKSHHVCNENSSRTTQTSHRERTLNDTIDAILKFKALRERIFGSSSIIAPIAFFDLGTCVELKVNDTLKGL